MTPEKKVLTPQQIDALCLEFNDTKLAVDAAQQRHSTAKGELLAVIQSQGYTPARAEKTMRIEGVVYIADATTGTMTEINEAAVGALQSELSRLHKPRVFSGLFERKVKHAMKKGADVTLKLAITKLGQPVQNRLLGIFASCFKVDIKSPSLSVEMADVLRLKEAAAAEKAAKKAAREAKQAAKSAKKAAKK
jgi:hypothetical protein